MTNLMVELKLAGRRLIRDAGFTAPAVATMAIGIGIIASVFALVEGVLIRPLPFPDADRLVSIRHEAPGRELRTDGVSDGILVHYRDRNRVFEHLGGYDELANTLTDGHGAERVASARLTFEVLSALPVVPQLGRLPAASEVAWDPSTGVTTTFAVLISHDLWVRRYGADAEIIGRTIEVDGESLATVVGVAKEGFSFPTPETELWFVLDPEDTPWWGGGRARVQYMGLNAVARLRPGVSLEEAEADLNRLVRLLPDVYPDITVEEIDDIRLRALVRPYKDEVVGEVRLSLLLVLASGAFLLLVTWANVTNLLLLRTHGRRGEIGIARALGATETHVARRLLSESLLLSSTGGLLGLGLAYLAIEARFNLAPHQLPRLDEVGVSTLVVGLVLAIAVTSGVLMGAICLVSTRKRAAGPVLSALSGRSAITYGRDGQIGRRLLVAAQMALALTLLVGSGLMARTFWHLQQIDLGFGTDGALSFYLPVAHTGVRATYHDNAQVYDEVSRRLRQVAGVETVEVASTAVFPLVRESGHLTTLAPVDAQMPGINGEPPALYGYATPGYFQAMRIPLLAGRTFRSEDTSLNAPGVIISNALARDLFGRDDPIGRVLKWTEYTSWADVTVVGVVGDVPSTTMREGGSRVVYLPHVYPAAATTITGTLWQYVPNWETYVIRSSRDFESLLPELRQAVHDVDSRLLMMDVATLDEIVIDATAQERMTMRLLLISAGAALFLGVVGIYAVLAYSVRRRTAELGIRLALGASPRRVTRLVVLQGALLSLGGIVAGLLAAFSMTRFIAALLYETSPTDPATFVGMAVLLFAVALLASYFPARRASRIDPAQALRAE